MGHPFAVDVLTRKLSVRETVDVRVLPTHVAVTGPADVALIEEVGITTCLL